MTSPEDDNNQREMLDNIEKFVRISSGLGSKRVNGQDIEVKQDADGKSILISELNLEAVLSREDSEGRPFIQVNFCTGQKILITENLIGFKPAFDPELEMDKLPKVVTTPDLLSVFEAIQEAIDQGDNHRADVELLKRVFNSVIAGGEAVGFDLSSERSWYHRLPKTNLKGSA